MGRTLEVKMAKADKDDIDKCIKFFRFIEEFMEYGTYTEPNDEVEEESIELDDEKFIEMLRKMWGGQFKPAGVDCSWSRVVFGCDILIDNVCDPDASTLEWHPDFAKELEPPKGLDEALDRLGEDREYLRKELTDKTRLLSEVCDYAARVAKKKRLPPWAIIGDMTNHGSGVASAIYELYRRKDAAPEVVT
jgi:hypothetical protein